ncbi:hypothetical protein pdam_00004135 [Pocillopora damicornis]|uniref:Uncharacterized protein n=1 Tax=Pocillopora damicornis TaxID=46731 RepID=A0A3M6TWI3_POCDA|nr:hypothetical protein pdam_00004135 [Pocillopora damicornis]
MQFLEVIKGKLIEQCLVTLATTDLPEETEAPGATEGPEETEAPEVTEGPEETEAPGATEGPEETEAPGVTEGPEETESPGATEGPEETEAPEVTEGPEETEAPEPTEGPEETEAPGATEGPEETEAPETTTINILDVTADRIQLEMAKLQTVFCVVCLRGKNKIVFVVVVVVARPVLVYWAVCGHENEISKQLKYEIEKSRKNRPADIES